MPSLKLMIDWKASFEIKLSWLFKALTVAGLFLALLKVDFARAESPQFIEQNSPKSLAGRGFSFLGHASAMWDSQRVSAPGVRNIIDQSRELGVEVVGVVTHGYQSSDLLYNEGEVSYIAESNAGQLRLKFSQTEFFVIGGGNLSLCLCETLRDLIIGSENKRPLHIVLATDAIYDSAIYWPLDGRPPFQGRNRFLLAEAMDVGDRDSIISFLEKAVIGESTFLGFGKSRRFCNQNYYNSPELDKSHIKFSVFFNTELSPAKTIGRGQREVRFILTESARVSETLRHHGLVD